MKLQRHLFLATTAIVPISQQNSNGHKALAKILPRSADQADSRSDRPVGRTVTGV